jgi:transcriptional regulator EpsA
MDDLIQLTSQEQIHFMRAIGALLEVRNRGGLFLCAQGQLRALMSHQVMVGLHAGTDASVAQVECLTGELMGADTQARLTDPQEGWAIRLVLKLREAGQLAWSTAKPGDDTAGLHAEIGQLGLVNALVVDTGPLPSGGCTVAFLGMSAPPSDKHLKAASALLPVIRLAMERSQMYQAELGQEDLLDEVDELTDRQVEILHWVKLGKTNSEIALILDISALTVKNHMQKLFKRLNVHNRAQAVARVMTMRLDRRLPSN